MLRKDKRPASRSGFTLVELLIVVTIIAILVAMAMAAVMKVMNQGAQTTARVEIGNLETGIAACKNDWGGGLKYLPSKLKLFEETAWYTRTTDPEALATQRFLIKMFGTRFQGQWVDWNGDGVHAEPPFSATGPIPTAVTIPAPECLVFYLGGIPDAPGNPPAGFSTDPTNPASTANRKAPYYAFQTPRLRQSTAAGAGYFFYVDPYTENPQPYIYLSSGARGNDYNAPPPAGTSTSDCTWVKDSAGNFVQPYRERSGGKFMNPFGFQIICAGRDNIFGDPTKWTPANGTTDRLGADDQANFSQGLLGGSAAQ